MAGSAAWHVCMVLLTDKGGTGLFRSLAVYFSGKVAFGEVVGKSAVRNTFGVPDGEKALLAVCNGDVSTVEAYSGEMKAAGVRDFIWKFVGGKRCA